MSDMYANDAAGARLAPGTRLNGIFEIERHIASGGMGEIYRGHAIETGDPVAIKVMRTDLADNETALALFRKEASALHHIHHEAIVRYYIFSNDPGTRRHYLAMEFVDGQPLSEILKRGALAFDEVQLLQRRIASGLHAAHQHGIIHRDVSPDNVIVPDGDVSRAKIIDFGIARSTRLGDRTVIGSGFAGKYNYVSPEQLGLFGGDVTAKSDIYSLGIVLAQCLSGQQIDMSGSEFEVIEKRRVVPDLGAVDKRYRPLLVRMLQPDPRDRPESMAEVAAWRPDGEARDTAAIVPAGRGARAQDGTGRGAAPGRTARRGKSGAGERLELAALILVALLSCGGVAFYLTHEPAPPGGLQPPKPLDPVQAEYQRLEREAALKRDEDERARQVAVAEAERQQLDREAAVQREADERARKEAAAAAEAERQRLEREAALKREADERARQEAAAAAAEAERQRIEREAVLKREAEDRARQEAAAAAAAEAERQKLEREAEERALQQAAAAAAAAETERQRLEREAALKREAEERARQEAVAAAAGQAERQRLEREAALKREAEERARLEAALKREAEERARLEAALKREAEQRARLEAAAAEAERQRLEREAALKQEAEERARQEAAAAAAAERQRLEREAALKREAEETARKEAAAAAAEAERQRLEREAALKQEAEERARLEAALKREAERRARLEAAAAEAERERLEREAALRREAEETARKEAAAAEAERQRLEREAALKREAEEKARQEAVAAAERQKLEREAALKQEAEEKARQEAVAAAAEAERQRLEREAALKREAEERARQEAAAAAEAERQRLEREAALKREAEERARLEAALKREAEERARLEAALKRETEDRARLQAAAAEAERQRLEREATLKQEAEERARKEAAAAAEAERQRLEREATLKREAEERARQQAADAQRQRLEREAALKREAEEKARQEEAAAAAAAAERQRLEREAVLKREAEERASQQTAAAERQRLQQEAALKSDADERLRRQVERQMRITRFVNNYEGGECFFVTPTVVAEDKTTLDGYGSSVAPFEALDTEFKRANGFEAFIGVHQVTQAQCAAVSFLSRIRNQPGLPPRLDISAASVKSGGAVTGMVAEFGDRHVELVLVADDGIVYNLTGRLRSDGDSRSFTLNLSGSDPGAAQPQLLLALVSNAPLEALKASRPGTAQEVFARVLREGRDTGQTLNVSAKYFKLEK